MFKTDNQRGPTIQHMELNVVWQPGWEESLRGNGYIHTYMAGPLQCSPETITTLLISCTLIQNKKLKNITGCNRQLAAVS